VLEEVTGIPHPRWAEGNTSSSSSSSSKAHCQDALVAALGTAAGMALLLTNLTHLTQQSLARPTAVSG
jgi:hypothetical protein